MKVRLKSYDLNKFFPLEQGFYLIGRGLTKRLADPTPGRPISAGNFIYMYSNNIQLPLRIANYHTSVSREHLKIIIPKDKNELLLEDMDSNWGSYLNFRRFTKQRIDYNSNKEHSLLLKLGNNCSFLLTISPDKK